MHACLEKKYYACAKARHDTQKSCEEWPHFTVPTATTTICTESRGLKVPDALSDQMVAGINCALSEVVHGLRRRVSSSASASYPGAGGLGVYATGVAKDMGAAR